MTDWLIMCSNPSQGPKGFDDIISKFPDQFRTHFRGKGHEVRRLLYAD